MTKEKLPDGFYFRASDHSYFMDGERMTGVTTILGTISKPSLIPWAARMATDYIKDNGIYNETEQTYEITEVQLEAARNAHTKKKEAGGVAGTDTHALVEQWIKSQISGNISDMDYKPIQPFIDWTTAQKITFIASEEKLYSKQMFVAGTADFLFERDGKRYIGDIKTYKKLWDRVPMLQCAGYGLMWREMNRKDNGA